MHLICKVFIVNSLIHKEGVFWFVYQSPGRYRMFVRKLFIPKFCLFNIRTGGSVIQANECLRNAKG